MCLNKQSSVSKHIALFARSWLKRILLLCVFTGILKVYADNTGKKCVLANCNIVVISKTTKTTCLIPYNHSSVEGLSIYTTTTWVPVL